ncbi:outer membrane beta-barrel protein [Chitinophagaceae bacterium 26-R-25]|nr:outer membrane beta-barrel protein [Chitinophagaceae bacterium 26-R-25]
MNKYFVQLVALFISIQSFSQSGTLKGKVESQQGNEKLSGAFVSCKDSHGKLFEAITEDDGEFKLKNISPGPYQLHVEYVGYDAYNTTITVVENKTTECKIILVQSRKSLAGVQVFASLSQEDDAGARAKEQRSTTLVNVISAKAMERSPDINAANVLQRMSGLSIQRNGGGDEAYAVIRGLDPRYSNTLINGIKIASPDEKSRFVPLSIVPSDILGSIEVHKTLTPDMEGDAIGGTVNMVMKNAPQKAIFKVSGSIGYNAIFFNRKYEKFSRSDIQQKSVIERKGADYVAQPDDFSRSNLDFKPVMPMPSSTFSLAAGKRFMHDKLGVMISESFQNQYYGSNSTFNQATINTHTTEPTYSDYAVRQFSTQQLNNGTVLHLDYEFNSKNKITFTDVLLYSFLAQSRTIVDTSIIGGNGGRTVPGTGPVSTDYLSVTSKQLIQNAKLEGKHILSKHFLFEWTGVFSYAKKRSPDFADIAVNKKIDTVHTDNDIHGPYTFVTTPDYFDAIDRLWQHNEDKDIDGLANISYKTKINENVLIDIKAGGLYRHKTRYNIQDEYQLKPTTSSSGIKQIYTNIYEAQWTVYNSHGTYDYDKNNYKLFEDVTAGYLQFKLTSHIFEVVAGAREEYTSQGYTMNTFHPAQINSLTKNYTDLLPSAMIKYKITARSNLRAAYFKSIARPNYYDLVPATIQSVSNATASTGNPQLKHSVADNFDLRYEFFPREEEQLFAGVFYKKVADPIESAYVNGTTYQPQNFGTAKVYGLELQFTKWLGYFGLTGNYTYLHSTIYSTKSYIDLAQNIAKDSMQKRSLQGQTGNTLNLSFLYKNDKQKIFVQVAYQYIGKTLTLVYPLFGYDYYQKPLSLLSLSAEKQLNGQHLSIFAKVNNILNSHQVEEINNLMMVNEMTNVGFNVGVRLNY